MYLRTAKSGLVHRIPVHEALFVPVRSADYPGESYPGERCDMNRQEMTGCFSERKRQSKRKNETPLLILAKPVLRHMIE